MMKRPRLSRPFCVSLLAVAGLLAVSYFPLSRIRANAGATILPSVGKPLVNLKTTQNLKLTYAGPADAVAALHAGTAIPTALAAADFNADGAMDVVAGYSGKSGGFLVLMRGNPDAFAPTDLSLYGKAAKGSVAPTFLSKAAVFALPESPDLLVTGDFNRDGYKDVLVASRGGALYLLTGDGRGNLLAPQAVPLPGQVTALAVTPDAHVAVSADGPNGPQLAMLSPGAEGLTAGAIYPLPARGDAMAWGSLGGGADLAVGAGANVVMFYNALGTNPQTEAVTVPFQVKGLTLGDFIWDRDGRTEIAVLADDGSIHILQHGTLNTAPVTAAELPARRAAIRGHHAKPTTPPNPTALGAWTVAKQLPYTGSAPSGPVSPSAFNSPRLAAASTQDLMVLDAGSSQLHILDTSGKGESPSAGISFTSTPVAAYAMPQKIDSGRDIVVLNGSQVTLAVVSNFCCSFTVTTTADVDPDAACTTPSVKSASGALSLREAVCLANNNASTMTTITTTINIGPGTYDLTSFETGELQVGNPSAGYILIINGTGTPANTIIQQTDGVDRIFEEDYFLFGNNPLTIQNVTLTGGNCSNLSPGDCGDGGGAIIAGAIAGDDLTLTNVVMSNNGANPTATTMNQANGGAIGFETPADLTITSSTFSNNTASGAGGAIDFMSGDSGGNISITNSTFTNNTNIISGGAASIQIYGGFTGSITGSTFTGNKTTESAGDGGAIEAETEFTSDGDGTFTMSNSRIVGNSAPQGATGVYLVFVTPTINNNWWGCNAGPNNSGCDTILQDVSGTNEPFIPATWLVLGVSANPTQIPSGGTSTLTADLTHNSSGTGGFSVPNGTPVTFGGTLDSSVNPTSTTLTSGQATSTYTAGSSAGNGTGTATVDNQPVSTPVDILVSVTVTTSPGSLSITVDGTTYTAPQSFNWVVGSTHTLNTTSPQSGPSGSQYVWSSWSQGGIQSQTVTAPSSSTTYTANFTTQYQLTTVASPSADGSVTPPSGQYFASGASIPVTATANAGFAFNNWTSTGGTFDSPTSASTNFHMPAAAATVTGNFVPSTVQITITTSPANLLVSVDGGTFTAAPLVESWNPGSTHTIATTSPQSGGTGIQYVFSAWSDSGAISHGITVPGTATTYTASFTTQYQLTTAANPSIGGTVSPTSGNYYNSGTVVPLTATANAGYSFTNWTGNVANSTSASTSITMTAPQSVTANFTLVIVAAPTTTSVSSNNNPSFTTAPGNSVTFTATVTSNSTVNEGTVTFSDPANDFTCSGGNTVPVSNGQAACTTSFSTEGSRNVTAIYNGTVNFQTSNGFITQTVNNHTVVTGNQFCNQGAITIPSTAGAATPYPSNIFVTGLSGNVGAVTVNLNNISSSDIAQTDLLLVGPTGAAIVPFASVGDSSSISGVNITLDDSASGLIPGGSPLISGSYQPTSITGSTTLVFPAPAPSITAANYAATDGAATLTSEFGGTAPNGTWALYAMDNSGNGAASIGGGWCVNITPPAVQTTITTSPAGLLVSVDGGTFTTAPLVENWVAGSSHTIATETPQAGGAGVQYVFSSWSDSGAISHSITVPSTATTYTASFNTQYQLSTQASPPADGSVTPASGSYYASGATIPVTATANAGFAFSNWTSTGGSFDSTTSASTNFHMPSAATTVTANFIALTTTALVSSSNPSTFGESVTFTASVTSSGSGTPNGTVSFENGTGSLVTIKLVGGRATLTTSALTAGSHTITAYYNGSTNYATSSSALSQTVDKVATTTTITNVSPSPSTYGQPVTFTATVSTTAGSASGNVEFTRLGSVPLSGGSASYTTTATQIPGGQYAITAVYNGDANHAASTSAAYTQTVNKQATTTVVMTSGSPSTFGNPVTFTATVSSSVGTPTGSATFKDGTTLLETVVLSGGSAQFTTSALAVGTHTIRVNYQGNGNDAVSSGQVTQAVQ